MITNPWFIALIVVVVAGHFIWFVRYAINVLKNETPESQKNVSANEQEKSEQS